MSYGQSIAPKIVYDRTARAVTKAAFAHYMSRALVRAGMKFLPTCSSYDVIDPQNEEAAFDFAGSYPLVFFFDFPTTEFFTVNSVQYRPMLGFRISGDSEGSFSANGYSSETVSFDLCVRPVGTNDCETFRSIGYTRSFGSTGYGLGGNSTSWASYLDGASYFDHDWLATNRVNWADFVTNWAHSPLVIQNIFVSLGPAGLVVCVGRGQSPSEFANVIGFSVVFFGERIPGRARAPINDPNLLRCNPAVLIPFRSTDGEYVTTPGNAQLQGHVLGVQFDLQSAPNGVDPIVFFLYNLSNLDRAAYPDYYCTVRNSPRLVSSVGRHILDPIIGTPNNRRSFASELYGPVDTIQSTTRVSPLWEDFFYAPKARWADITAPVGEYVDPDTNQNWWLVPIQSTGMRLAVNVEGATNETVATIPAPTVLSTEAYDLTSAGFSSVFPRAATFLRDDVLGSGLVAQNFTPVASTNAMLASWPFQSANWYRRTRMRIPIPAAEDPERLFSIVFDMYVRTTQVGAPTSTTNAPYVAIWIGDVFGGVPVTNLTVIGGRSAAEQGYDLRTYVFPLPRSHRADSGDCLADNVNIAWHAYDPNGANPGGTYTARVENIRLQISKR